MGRHLKELRIVISSTGEVSSNGAREWILRRTEEMRSLNPNFPFYIREGLNIEPYMQVGWMGRQYIAWNSLLTFSNASTVFTSLPRITCRWNTTGERLQSTHLLV